MRRWMSGMMSLAEAVERLLEPVIKEQRTAPGPEARQKVSNFTSWAIAAALVGIPLCAVSGGMLAYLLIVN